jgi:galactose oxidase-like protein
MTPPWACIRRRARSLVVLVLIAASAGCTAAPSLGPSAEPSLVALPTATVTAPATMAPTLIPPPTAGPATWTSTGDRITAGQPLAATLLLDGRVLVVDGPDDVHSQSNSAELYDPASGTWAATGTLITPRYDAYTVTRLADGTVLVAGGSNARTDDLAAAELYDPATGAWARTGRMNQGRFGHTATLLPNGQVLVTGGVSLYGPATAELYDPATGSWAATGHMLKARIAYTATLLLDGRVLVAGGLGDDNALAAAEIYDPGLGTWTATGRMVNRHADYVSALLPDGKVLLVASNGNEVYNPKSGSWTRSGPMAAHNAGALALTLLADGRVLVVGCCNDPVTVEGMGAAELFDEATGVWTAIEAMTDCGGNPTAVLPNGSVLVLSGSCTTDADGNDIPARSAELFHPGG